jgi:hypothetical protein
MIARPRRRVFSSAFVTPADTSHRSLTEEVVAFLKDWIDQRKLTDPEAIVFPFASASSLTSAFRKACKRAKIKDLRLHDLPTRFWKTHKDLALLKEFLGDRDTESVMR